MSRATQVALLGAAGGIGQPLGLLLKMNKYISELSLYDLAPFTPGVAKDLSHCNTPSKARERLCVTGSMHSDTRVTGGMHDDTCVTAYFHWRVLCTGTTP